MNPDFLILFIETYLKQGLSVASLGLVAVLAFNLWNNNKKLTKAIEKISKSQEKFAEFLVLSSAKQNEHSDALSRLYERVEKVESKVLKNEMKEDKL